MRAILLTIWVVMGLATASAQPATTQAAQVEAVRLYPELGQAGSPMNQRFLRAVDEARRTRDPVLAQADWPLTLAKRVAGAGEQEKAGPFATQVARALGKDVLDAEAYGRLFGLLMGAALGAAIGGVILRFATQMVAGFTPSFNSAWLAVFVGSLGGFMGGIMVGLLIGESDRPKAAFIGSVLGFFVQVVVNASLLKDSNRETIGFIKGFLVTLVQSVMTLLLVGAIALIILFVQPGWR